MTDAELLRLYKRRQEIWEGYSCKKLPLRDYPADERAKLDRESEEFKRLDASIIDELISRKAPAVLGLVTLHLLCDLDGFAALETGTRRLAGQNKVKWSVEGRLLWDYAKPFPATRQRRPASATPALKGGA